MWQHGPESRLSTCQTRDLSPLSVKSAPKCSFCAPPNSASGTKNERAGVGYQERRPGTSERHRREKGRTNLTSHFTPLLSSGYVQTVNINEQIDGRPPILYAADYGHTDVIEYLISAGADVNVSI